MRRSAVLAACRLLFNKCPSQHLEPIYRYIGHITAAVTVATDSPAAPSSATGLTSPWLTSSGGRATLLDGRTVAAAWERELLGDVQLLTELLGRPPGLGVVLVGSRPDSMLYVTKKQEACQKAGMQTFVHHLPETVSQAQLEAAVSHACADCRVDGVLIQLPLPRHLSEEAVMEVLDPRKDVDGFHPINMGRMLMRGRGVRLVPATPLGCIELLRRSDVDVQGKTCVVLGDSNIVGTPLAAMLRDKGAAAVTICHRRSYREWFEDQDQVQRKRAAAAVCLPHLPGPSPRPPAHADAGGSGVAGADSFQSYQLPDLTRSADILVVAVGHPELVRRDWVRPGAVVIDVGINVISTLPRNRAAGAIPPAPQNRSSLQATLTASATEPSTASPSAGAGPDAMAAASPSALHAAAPAISVQSGTPVTSPDLVTGDVLSSGGKGNGGGWAANGSAHNRNVMFQVVGDVAFEEVSQVDAGLLGPSASCVVAGAITPVPGGVGPMTIAAVLHNTIKAAKYRAGLEPW